MSRLDLLLSSSQLQPYAESKLTANAPYLFCLPAHQRLLARLMYTYCFGTKHGSYIISSQYILPWLLLVFARQNHVA